MSSRIGAESVVSARVLADDAVGHDYALRLCGLFPTPFRFIPGSLSNRRLFGPRIRRGSRGLVSSRSRGRHPVAFRLYLSGTACLLVAQPLYIKRQGACRVSTVPLAALFNVSKSTASASCTRICHQINTMSSRRFLPSSPSFDLFLARCLPRPSSPSFSF